MEISINDICREIRLAGNYPVMDEDKFRKIYYEWNEYDDEALEFCCLIRSRYDIQSDDIDILNNESIEDLISFIKVVHKG
jgi:hypothetical protein